MTRREPVKVLFTVDTEVWPQIGIDFGTALEEDIQRDIFGFTREGEFGIRFQCQMLEAYGQKAVFFVDSLFATVHGIAPLQNIVDTIKEYKVHGVELHAHPEWARHFHSSYPLAGKRYEHFHQLGLEHQISLLELACRNLRSAGVENILGFRAGNYGANIDTCRAAAAVGIPFDFSYNPGLEYCKIDCGPARLTQPALLGGVVEYPTSFFLDYGDHVRHVQLCACSIREIQFALQQAWEEGWEYFVILSHSHELIRNRKRPDYHPRVNPTVVRRMEELCRFLRNENDRFETITCRSLNRSTESASTGTCPSIKGRLVNTGLRYAEQAWIRIT